jgi:chromatin segregation and condensation protein Rec8/ScpA/Scc1 (kleisin family)
VTTRVQVEIFEGPLDLLLHLIKKNEVSIADIPIATITEQYLATLEVIRAFNLDVAGNSGHGHPHSHQVAMLLLTDAE